MSRNLNFAAKLFFIPALGIGNVYAQKYVLPDNAVMNSIAQKAGALNADRKGAIHSLCAGDISKSTAGSKGSQQAPTAKDAGRTASVNTRKRDADCEEEFQKTQTCSVGYCGHTELDALVWPHINMIYELKRGDK